MSENNQPMTVAEAGRLGGQARKEAGADYSQLGKQGGAATKRRAEQQDPEFFSRNGQKGGKVLLEQRGKEFYQEIGRRGGLARARQREEAARRAAEGAPDAGQE